MTFSYSKTLERQEKNQIASCWDNTASQSTSCLVTKQGFSYCMSQTYPKKEVKLLTKHLQITFKYFSTVDSTQLVSDQVKNRAYRSDTKCRLVSAPQINGSCAVQRNMPEGLLTNFSSPSKGDTCWTGSAWCSFPLQQLTQEHMLGAHTLCVLVIRNTRCFKKEE